jgi:Bacterial Ig-like domain
MLFLEKLLFIYMNLKRLFSFVGIVAILIVTSLLDSGCAQVGYPTGGARDTLAPVLVKANPEMSSTNVKTDKFAFTFNEYIDLADLQQNLVISPLQNKNPNITANPKTINLKFRDSLLPNTTYTINFGDAVRDINESNILKNFTYVFSTGNTIDSGSIAGKIYNAETGNIDSTIIVMLYTNIVDSLVQKKKPNYTSKVKGDGSFEFKNLPSINFNIYGLKDGDGSKTYNTETELFAFKNETVSAAKNETIELFAYTAKKEDAIKSPTTEKINKDKKLTYTTNLIGNKDILEPMEIKFSNAIKITDTSKLILTDTFFKKQYALQYKLDSTLKQLTINTKLQLETPYVFILNKEAVKDTFNKIISKTDTIRFVTMKEEDYGKVVFNFNGLDLGKNPVLQFLQSDVIKNSYKLTGNKWSDNLFLPGEYEIRILYDTNKDGSWTPGNYSKKLQPEIAVTLPQRLTIRANWDNERDINL